MDLKDYLRIVRRGWIVIVAAVVLGLAGGIGITLATTKVYQANVQIFVATSPTTDQSQLAQGNIFTQGRVQSYTSVANSPDVTGPVVKRFGGLSGSALAGKITADAPQNKTLINLHVTDTDPALAARLANAVAAEFNSVVATKVEQSASNGRPVVKLTVIHPASTPSSPIKPNRAINIGLGFVIGLIVGIGLVIVREVLDNTVKGPAEFEELGVPVLALIPLDKRTDRVPIAFRGDPHSVRSEAYRQLRTNLQFVNVDSAPSVIAISSAIPGEGKSTTAMNLAAALAEAGYRVVLVEADLRRPTIAKTLGLVAEAGFTTALIGMTAVADVMQNVGRNLAVLTSGPVPPNPSELLNSEQARAVIAEVAAHADYTIIDTAPLLPVADGAEVAALAEATVVVHQAGRTTRDQARRSVEALAKVGERPVGVVLNMVKRASGRYNGDYNYYYQYRPDRDRRDGNSKRQPPGRSARHSPNGVALDPSQLEPAHQPAGPDAEVSETRS